MISTLRDWYGSTFRTRIEPEGGAIVIVQTRWSENDLVGQVLDLAHSGGRGCLGAEATEKALRESRVDTLLLSRSYISENPDHADRCVGTAFNQEIGRAHV